MNLELKENHIMHWLMALQKPAIPFLSLVYFANLKNIRYCFNIYHNILKYLPFICYLSENKTKLFNWGEKHPYGVDTESASHTLTS